MRRPSSATLLAALLTGAGVLHFAVPGPYESIVPPLLGYRRAIVYVSGAVEMACGAAVAMPSLRQRGGLASALLFVAVFPANVYMAIDDSRPALEHVVAIARLPLQVPLVVWALRVARRAQAARSR